MNIRAQKSSLYNFIKTFTTILVVFGHVIVMYTVDGAIQVAGESAILVRLKEIIYSFHIPLFYIVTGAVYGFCIETGKYKDGAKHIWNKCNKLLLPYLFFGIFYVTPVMKYVGLLNGSMFEYILEGILLARNPRHLWFLGSLFWMYVIFLPFKEMIRKEKLWVLPVIGVISNLVYHYAYAMPQDFQIRRACLDQIWFFAGIVFNRCYGYFSFLWNRLETATKYFTKLWDNPLMKKIAKNSFGIYLIHPMIIYVLFHWFGMSRIHPVILSGGIFVVTMILSVAITEWIRKTVLKFIIGE